MKVKLLKINAKSLLGKLTITFSLLVMISLTITGVSTFFITKDKVTIDFKNSSMETLKQNENYVELITTVVEDMTSQVYSNKKFVDLANNINAEGDKDSSRSLIGAELMNMALSNNLNIIKGMTFYSENGLTGSYPRYSRTLEQSNIDMDNIKKQPWYDTVIKNNGKPYWLPPHDAKLFEGKTASFLSCISVFKDSTGTKVAGILEVNISVDTLNKALKNSKLGKNGYIYIIDGNGKIVAHKDGTLAGTQLNQNIYNTIKSSKTGNFNFKDGNTSMYGVYSDSTLTDWKYVAVVPKSELSATAINIQKYTLVITLLCLIACVIISILTSMQILKPINEIIGLTKELAGGNLMVKSKVNKILELNELSKNFNNMTEKLRFMLTNTMKLAVETDDTANRLVMITEEITQASEQVSSAICEISDGSSEQVENTLQCKDTSCDLDIDINKAVEGLGKVSTEADNCLLILEDSRVIIRDLTNSSESNAGAIEEVSDTISELKDNTKNILLILNKINEITNQTNLLSLNASIEAARAGEYGKGFAVVADEIRKLSGQSQNASVEISKIIKQVNGSINSTIEISNNAKITFAEETNQVIKTIKSFDSMKLAIENVVSSMYESINSINLIEKGKSSLSDNINNIAMVAEKNAAATQQVTASVEEQCNSNEAMHNLAIGLNDKAKNLKEVLESFKF